MNIENYNEKVLKTKVDNFLNSLGELSSKLNGDIYNIRSIFSQFAKDIPVRLDAGLSSSRSLMRRKNFAIAKETLNQCRTYLSILNSLRIVSVKELLNQIDEINNLMENQLNREV